MHIAVFYQYFNSPDNAATARHYTFLHRWAQRHTLTLITTRTWYDQRITRSFEWVPANVRLVMLDVPYENQMGRWQRLRAFQGYAARAWWAGLRMPRPDVVFGTSTPLTAAWVAHRVARWHRIPWVFEVRDLWPDFPIQMGAVRQPWLQQRLYALERRLYRSAAHIIPLSPDMQAHIARQGIAADKMTVLVNGTDFPLLEALTDADVAVLRDAFGLTGKRVVLYGGTFGRANDIPTLLAAAERLRGRDDLRFVLAGHGFFAEAVAAVAQRLPNLVALPPQPRPQMLAWCRLADLALVPFIDLPVLAANSPAKLFDSLGAGTPVLVTNDGWTRHLVETHRCGWYVPPSNPMALAARIEQALHDPDQCAAAGRNGARLARQQFDRVEMADRLEAILLQVAAQGEPMPG
jgi:glycosyltransferase involved in cell wall biosynthesis